MQIPGIHATLGPYFPGPLSALNPGPELPGRTYEVQSAGEVASDRYGGVGPALKFTWSFSTYASD